MHADTLKILELCEAYFEFLQTGKLYPFAKMALEMPEHGEIFLRAVRDLDSGKSYPFTISKLPEKMRPREQPGRPKKDEFFSDMRLTFYKVAVQKFTDIADWKEGRILTKKELLSKLTEMDMPKSFSIDRLSLSSKYDLLSKIIQHEPKNPDLQSMFEVILLDHDEEYMGLCISKDR